MPTDKTTGPNGHSLVLWEEPFPCPGGHIELMESTLLVWQCPAKQEVPITGGYLAYFTLLKSKKRVALAQSLVRKVLAVSALSTKSHS